MKQEERLPFHEALRPSRLRAYPPGQFVGQESFMRADEIRVLAEEAGVGPGTRVLDICCGVGGPGLLIARESRCSYLGVDGSAAAVRIARGAARAVGDAAACRFEVSPIPPVPAGRYDVVLLLETLLAFADKADLLRQVSAVLAASGRFAFTVEEGVPLTAAERAVMPDADNVRLVPLAALLSHLSDAGLRVRWCADWSRRHLTTARSLYAAYLADACAISARIGRTSLDELLTAHQLWVEWLRLGRVRKFALVAEKASGEIPAPGEPPRGGGRSDG